MNKENCDSTVLLSFQDLETNSKPEQLESLCINCLEQGITTFFLTKIPYFREIMISRFECPHCEYCDKSIQFAGEYPDKGVHFELHVKSAEDLNRRIVKSSHCTINIEAIKLEIPGTTQGNTISTIEGILNQAYTALKTVKQTPEMIEFLDNLYQCKSGQVQFDFIIDDPTGNSFIENPSAPNKDPNLDVTFYHRTTKQNDEIGLASGIKVDSFYIDDDSSEFVNGILRKSGYSEKVDECPVCSSFGNKKKCTLNFPGFKETVITDFSCEQCGYRTGEVNICGPLSKSARIISLHCDSKSDLDRHIIKSEAATVRIDEIDLTLADGIVPGKFTTIRGLLNAIRKRLIENNPFTKHDRSPENLARFEGVVESLKKFIDNEEQFTLVIRDPLSNSHVMRLGEKDKISIVDEPRTEEENEELGLNEADE